MTGDAIVLLLLLLSFGTSTPVFSDRSRGTRSGIAARCVHWKAEVRFEGLGFNHYVHLHNRCEAFMRCEVRTSVNKKPVTVNLAPDAKRTIKTFTGSPSSVFKTYVACTNGALARSDTGTEP